MFVVMLYNLVLLIILFYLFQLLLDFDLILAMDSENYNNIQRLKKTAMTEYGVVKIRAEVALMSEHDTIYPKQAVPDPYYGDASDFERVLDQCASSSQAWVEVFQKAKSEVTGVV